MLTSWLSTVSYFSLYSKTLDIFLPFSTRYAFAEYCFVGLVFYLPIQWPKPLWIYYHCISSNISELKIFGTIHSRTRRKTGQGGLDCGYDV
jgi:hypothetical protein